MHVSLHVSCAFASNTKILSMTKALFRSHLMQQFAAAARHQSRPPLALAAASSIRNGGRQSSTPRGTLTVLSTSTSTSRDATSRQNVFITSKSSAVERSAENAAESLNTAIGNQDTDVDSLASSFQSLITSRRTQPKFSPTESAEQVLFLRQALDRAIVCAQAAPNHHKTEPFCFKRMMAPSDKTRQLSTIASRVVFQKKLHKDPEHAQAHADRKYEKWNQIPAFLVALVEDNQQGQVLSTTNEFEPMEYLPPITERQLEDYASACAAVQNILLSLHADGIGTKWATGPVVQTPAFRQLVGCRETDRVVGLIMVGYEPHKTISKRRYRKQPQDLVEDL